MPLTGCRFAPNEAGASITDAVVTARSTVEALAGQPGLSRAFDNTGQCTLAVRGTEAFRSVRLDVVSPDGVVGCSSDPALSDAAERVHAGSGWLQEATRGGITVVSWDATDAFTGQPAVVAATPFFDAGTVRGAVALVMHVPDTATALAEDLLGADRAGITIVDRSSGLIVSSSDRAAHEQSRTEVDQWAGQRQWTGIDGATRLFGSSDVPGSTWRVYAGAERSAVLDEVTGTLLRQVLVGVVALLATGAAMWSLNRRVAGPLQALTAAVVRAGTRTTPGQVRLEQTGTAELVTLTREFNAMLDVRAGHEAQLAHQATHDPLTGLPNRIPLREWLDHALADGAGRAGVAVLSCGLRGFKVINDSLDHDAGDRVLAAVAERLRTAMRRSDALVRFGGDEFVVLCRDTSSDDAVRVAERLQDRLAEPFPGTAATSILLRAAIGIAVSSGQATTSSRLLREAASAMRRAKEQGQSWSIFDDTLHARATQRLEDEEALRQAISSGQFVIHYQPLHDVASGTLVGAEALVRWQHPSGACCHPTSSSRWPSRRARSRRSAAWCSPVPARQPRGQQKAIQCGSPSTSPSVNSTMSISPPRCNGCWRPRDYQRTCSAWRSPSPRS